MKKLFTNKRKEKFIRWIERVIGYKHPPIKMHDFTDYKKHIKMVQSTSVVTDMELELYSKSPFISQGADSIANELLERKAISIEWKKEIGQMPKLIMRLYYIEDMENLT